MPACTELPTHQMNHQAPFFVEGILTAPKAEFSLLLPIAIHRNFGGHNYSLLVQQTVGNGSVINRSKILKDSGRSRGNVTLVANYIFKPGNNAMQLAYRSARLPLLIELFGFCQRLVSINL
jgi:hypothetical protein